MKTIYIFLLLIASSVLVQGQNSADSLNYYIQNFQFKKALQVIDNQETNKSNLFQKAMCYKALGENKMATNILMSLSEEYPGDIQIKTELAHCYERAAKWSESSDAYADLMAMDTTNLYFMIKKAESEINRKDYKTAISDLKTVLKADSLSNAMRLLGKGYESTNNLDSAVYYYKYAWDIDSTDVFSASNLVNVLLKANKYEEEYGYSRLYQEMDPTNKQMNMLFGYTLYAMEDYGEASKVLQKCFSAGDSSTVVTRSLGMSYYYNGEKQNSYEYLSKAFAQDTTNSTVLYNLAVSSNDVDEYDLAIIYHKKILDRLIPKDMSLYLNYRGVAIAYEKKEEYSDAFEYYRKASEYATTDQQMNLNYTITKMLDDKMDSKANSMVYYDRYRYGLLGYISYLKSQEASVDEIKELEGKIKELEQYIAELKIEVESNPKYAPITEKDILFVVNNKVATEYPRGKKVINARNIIKFEDAPKEDVVFVELAKKQGKRMITLLELTKEEEAEPEVN